MSILRSKGKPNIGYFPKKASTAFTPNTMANFTVAGDTIETAGATTSVIGVCLREVKSSDADYAAKTLIPVDMAGDTEDEFIADVTGGTASTANIGLTYDLNASASAVNIAATAADGSVRVVGFVSPTQLRVKFVDVSI